MNTTEMTLERSLGQNFFPHSIKECEEKYIGENNWTENEGEYDSDLERNRDLVNSTLDSKLSPHPYRNYQKKEGKGWKNGEPDSEHIALMTKKFLKDGGSVEDLGDKIASESFFQEVIFGERYEQYQKDYLGF